VQLGRELARANCARCHSIERSGESPIKSAPPFRSLHQRYPVEYLEEALAEGIVTGHPDMTEFRVARSDRGLHRFPEDARRVKALGPLADRQRRLCIGNVEWAMRRCANFSLAFSAPSP
jgi:hypothetical protein